MKNKTTGITAVIIYLIFSLLLTMFVIASIYTLFTHPETFKEFINSVLPNLKTMLSL